MPNVAVEPVSTRRQRKAFLEFPWMLYRDDPNWIPPLRGDQKAMVGFARHPFYHRNRVQTFLAYRGGEVSRFREDVRTFLSLYNRSLTNTWGFVPMSEAEIDHLATGLQHLIVPEMAIAVEIDGRVVGATFGLPDYNPRIRDIDSRLFPFGFIRLLRKKQAIKKIRIISTNVLPEYQLQGLGVVLMDSLVPKAREWGIEEAEFSWVLESNSFSRGALEKGGAKITKTYRLYDLN